MSSRVQGLAHLGKDVVSLHRAILRKLLFTHQFTTTTRLSKKEPLPPRPKVPESETTKAYLKGSGPGGQKINKTSSAVQLTHLPTGIVVKSQATRSRTQNESIARRLLAEKVEWLEKGKNSRLEKKRERESKKRRSAEKKSRRKYRKLAEESVGGLEHGASTAMNGISVPNSQTLRQESEGQNEFKADYEEIRKAHIEDKGHERGQQRGEN